MALLVKERKALEGLERSIVDFYNRFLQEEIIINPDASIEERLLFVKAHIEMIT